MKDKIRKIKKYMRVLDEQRRVNRTPVSDILSCPCDYKTDNTLPSADQMFPFENGSAWGTGIDTHAWFRFNVKPTCPNTVLRIETEHNGWNPENPQFIIYINGEMIQGLDTNHRELPLIEGVEADVVLYAYTGSKTTSAHLYVNLIEIYPELDALYFDLKYPFDMLSFLDNESDAYARIVDHLWHAVSMLYMYDVNSREFLDSVVLAREYLSNEFYGKFCEEQKFSTVGIGHTHIDCAWLWTLKQTREKVQRSFSTVLELMRRYPDYKFMSSQAFLYKNLKEEAPEIYKQVAERIKEGRWECEGSMWVEADCNLSSGESLVRQIIYGKNFFKDEFGVENKILWLPDVFGYTAALPQILRKCGVDWFITSKISWNDTNRMPHDTFRWKGIDGTEIDTHFITDSDHKAGRSENFCTYCGHTGSTMVSGTYRRYTDKNLNNEALLTFGFGDGGGGPTPEDLELAARGAKGIPGVPNIKIDFVGNYLARLRKNMEMRKDIPTWHGELYLEFHRGTYTTLAKNKRHNRQCEFLYTDAELLGTLTKTLIGKSFPKAELRRGWEMILTNQFHDIIPGSSIKEVYDQSDIDYTEIKSIGNSLKKDAYEAIASGIDSSHGYVVFNPHSFTTEGLVKINGKSAFTDEKISSKGYLVSNKFITKNNVKIDGRCVDTERLHIEFDEFWQMTSIYDKKADREVLKAGQIGNELRAYADYPDEHDAWEWQAFSREEHRAVSAFTEMSIIDDGIRKGIRVIRPYMNSTIEQTMWFYDELCRIDFDTHVDWHERHQMLKTVFPVDINSDKATYEIQFGTVERPTHFNTSWDTARFEVCAHKYADLSDGGYGVAIMNDCKYGHDIHDGVIHLSLLRAPTYPNPEADQGEIDFAYSIVPHEGRIADTDVAKQAYYLNYPMTAVAATGNGDKLPLSFSALSLDVDNVICEVVKQGEKCEDTVVRLYECKNKRTNAAITFGLPAKEVFLCDMMENELEKLEVADGKVNVRFNGFEIITLKIKA